MKRKQILESAAGLFAYPSSEYVALAEECCGVLERELTDEANEDIRAKVRKFRTVLNFLSVNELEEIYTRTFDLNPVCSLDIGWHLYAENYERGTFLVEMRNALKEHGLKETSELPDHLPMVFRLLARMEPGKAAALAEKSVFPALRKMVQGFPDSRNPYASLIGILEPVLFTTLRLESGGPPHDDHR